MDEQKTINLKDKKEKVTAKKVGLKSTLIYDGKMALTSFAKAKESETNSTNIEQVSSYDGEKVFLKNPILFNASVSQNDVIIQPINKKLHKKDVRMPNPAKEGVKKDYVGIKGVLENKYFGGIKSNDNIHVQIAYNIADIKKLLIPYMEQIIYLCYNLNRKENNLLSKNDVIGTLYFQDNLQKFRADKRGTEIYNAVEDLLGNAPVYSAYFSELFKVAGGKVSPKVKDACDEHNFNVLRTLSMIRQSCMHSKIRGSYYDPERLLFDRNVCKQTADDLYAFLNSFADGVFAKTNEDFCKTAQNNIYVLNKVYPSLSVEEIIKGYYNYVVIKENNNVGMNLKLLRETMIYYYLPELKEKEYDKYRQKIYTIMGYIIFNYLKGSDLLEETVAELRAVTTEEKKLDIYAECASKVWQGANALIQEAIRTIEFEIRKKEESERAEFSGVAISKEQIAGYIKQANTLSHFAKILLFVCSFLNGKEINELLCAFINKFDGIADLLYSAKKCGYNITFGADYKEIEKARNIANDIRIIKNVARMKRDPEKFSGQMMLDVVKLLGIKSNVLEESDVYESSLTPAESKKIIERINKNKDNKQLRNFLKNNVVKSKWFFYIIRYMKPENCAKLMRNHKMVAFVLNGIDDKQIIRYYQSVQGIKLDENCVEDGRKTLAKRLAEFNIDSVMDTIENMPKREYENNAQPSAIKEKNKALVTLYLTVAYLIVKNIVKINTNFNIAFSCLERDYVLMFCPQNDRNIDLLAVTKRFLDRDERLIAQYNKLRDSIRDNASWSKERKREEYKALKDIEKEMHFSLHHYYCVKKNYATALALVRRTKSNEINLLRTYRNNVAHLNVVNAFPCLLDDIGKITSYYDVYVYSMQRLLIDEQLYYAGMYNDELSVFVQKYNGLLNKHNTYVKDLSWIINVPFAYNVSRYKNLCIKELFYGELSKEKIGTEEPQEKKEISCPQIVEEEESIVEVDEEVELAYGYFSEQIVTMANVEATARGGLRGVISGTQYKITVPPAIVQESGNAPESYVGKEIEVRITDWSKGGNSFSSELV